MTVPPTRCFALVPCAGVGLRAGAGGPKQYAPLAGRPVVAHTLAALAAVPRLAGTLVVLSPEDTQFEAAVPGWQGWIARRGGATRAESVANGLPVLRELGARDDDWVLVHDAARCLLRPEWVDRLIDACLADPVGGLLALPLADTLKAEEAGRVADTVPRAGKWAAQTPQMFRIGLLARALAEAGDQVTDESSAVEALGLAPRLVAGDLENLKVTWPADFALAARLLQTR
ncbi:MULTISPECIES: 2-C-methyl-D-erythritol 4-phosphate cytidylyltransferase [Rubrivivax]|uniref:2-C-methyl-D-erythritol 4-phosphate cytidylyltransferase n=1 Tax=Rubrivivax benzoatilyticus TaxID=316997 RepID=A0ABX0HTJ5_9BURK|nr:MULTISPECIES: 2-C-methyl-D-erythritol 4-phosphate cytidylyltransferase [Rubrivivax]EGJ09334.1 2-C-methyl-D-erythritol 4-phosphate cytidylyltransferase [Rubrivivax benzoatilyticus JA2 = ATCC BAA-35]MCC9597539.1 2-C-methyl-D-erythritol 4-phosphate cytidylyltransferase [Rubrivivax sp. JA1055]MCC9646203.1 2-C-methyl-D-erythritol 4-phosphate cytidylyltransferase [Rubrivivax sp. JA1029]NHK98347.1 2-C-methyl-D-erythritol 4-phosphate cytidylyltransferase [Rubrivivax benzoatilyticus]NHL23878.1 2-C-m